MSAPHVGLQHLVLTAETPQVATQVNTEVEPRSTLSSVEPHPRSTAETASDRDSESLIGPDVESEEGEGDSEQEVTATLLAPSSASPPFRVRRQSSERPSRRSASLSSSSSSPSSTTIPSQSSQTDERVEGDNSAGIDSRDRVITDTTVTVRTTSKEPDITVGHSQTESPDTRDGEGRPGTRTEGKEEAEEESEEFGTKELTVPNRYQKHSPVKRTYGGRKKREDPQPPPDPLAVRSGTRRKARQPSHEEREEVGIDREDMQLDTEGEREGRDELDRNFERERSRASSIEEDTRQGTSCVTERQEEAREGDDSDGVRVGHVSRGSEGTRGRRVATVPRSVTKGKGKGKAKGKANAKAKGKENEEPLFDNSYAEFLGANEDEDADIEDQHAQHDSDNGPSKKRRISAASDSPPLPYDSDSSAPTENSNRKQPKKPRHKNQGPTQESTEQIISKVGGKHLEQDSSSQSENPDRDDNPNRLKSFTHWHDERKRYVPDKIWLHAQRKSWKHDSGDINGQGGRLDREDVVEWVEENGGRVIGDGTDLTEIAKAEIVVVPRPGSRNYKAIYRVASSLGKTLVNTAWILSTLRDRDEIDTPGFRFNPLRAEFEPPFPLELINGGEYQIKEEEEKYWLPLARRVSKLRGAERARSKQDMFRRMEHKFRDKYHRDESCYSRMYDRFLGRMLEFKRRKYPAPRSKKAQQRLERVKLFTSDSEEELGTGDAQYEDDERQQARSGERDLSLDGDASAQSHSSDNTASEIFRKKKRTKPNARASRGSRQRYEGEDEGEDQRGESMSSSVKDPSGNGFSATSEDEGFDQECQEKLAAEYGRPLKQIQSIGFYSNGSLCCVKEVLDLLRRAKQLPKSENAQRGDLLAEAKRKMFSDAEDGALLRLWRESHKLLTEAVKESAWQRLKRSKELDDRQLHERIRFLEMGGPCWDPTSEERKQVQDEFWYPKHDDF